MDYEKRWIVPNYSAFADTRDAPFVLKWRLRLAMSKRSMGKKEGTNLPTRGSVNLHRKPEMILLEWFDSILVQFCINLKAVL